MGCDYTGKRALAERIVEWWHDLTGSPVSFHDHFTPPFHVQDNPTTDEDAENEQLASMVPSLLEKFQRYQIEYHIRPFARNHDLLAINHYYGDAVYAPLYLGYGQPGEYGDRRMLARHYDKEMLEVFPDVVLVMMKASPSVVRERMAQERRPGYPVTEDDVEMVLERFQEQYDQSIIFRRFALDTSEVSGEETFESFVAQIDPLISEQDALRILRHKTVVGSS
jgi:hypothetical protein